MKRKSPPRKIEMVPVSALVPYENNPRVNEDAIPKVKASFRKFGVINPIIINAGNVILCGHTRLAVAKELGLSELPCVRVTDLTPEQERAYRLADNKTAEYSLWDFPKLEVELDALDGLHFDMADLGFPSAFSVDAGDAPLKGYSIGGGEGADRSGALEAAFGVPPFSVLDIAREPMLSRAEAWKALGIRSELGRGAHIRKRLDAKDLCVKKRGLCYGTGGATEFMRGMRRHGK